MQLTLPQRGKYAPRGLYLHLTACANEQIGQVGSCTLSITAALRALLGFRACTGAHPLKHPRL